MEKKKEEKKLEGQPHCPRFNLSFHSLSGLVLTYLLLLRYIRALQNKRE